MNERPRYYVLLGRTPIAVDLTTWARSFDLKTRRIAEDEIDGRVHVSTVFLGLDHSFMDKGDPVLFETMTFGGPLDQQQRRYCTYAQAERGHAEAVAETRAAIQRVRDLAKISKE